MENGIAIEILDGTARVTLDRADRHNAFDEGLIGGLTETFLQFDADPDVDTVVLAARGKSFSAGGDLDWMKRAAQKDRNGNFADALALAQLFHALDELSKPTVAVVQGAAYGGGVGLIACCDIAIGSETAKFALTEVRLGLIPAAISPYVLRAIGPRQARRYFQTAEIFSADDAARMGLLHEVVTPDTLEARAAEIIAAIRTTAPQARKAAKRLISDVSCRAIDENLMKLTAERIADIRSQEEAREGLSAFFERRKPGWQNREDKG